MDSVFKFLGRE